MIAVAVCVQEGCRRTCRIDRSVMQNIIIPSTYDIAMLRVRLAIFISGWHDTSLSAKNVATFAFHNLAVQLACSLCPRLLTGFSGLFVHSLIDFCQVFNR